MKIILIIIASFLSVNLFAQMPENSKCPCDYPSLFFIGKETQLSTGNKNQLTIAAKKLKEHPFCSFTLDAYTSSSKIHQRLCQMRLDIIKRYLVEIQGISSDRIITNCEIGGGRPNSIEIKCDN